MTPVRRTSQTSDKDLLARQSALLERAIAALDQHEAAPAAQDSAARASKLLARAMAALEAATAAPPAPSSGARMTAMLHRAITIAEQKDAEAKRLEALLVRALKGIAALEDALAARECEIDKRGAALDELLTLSERSLSAASQRESTERGNWRRRLFGSARQTQGS